MQVQVNEVARVSVFGGFTFLVLCLLIGLAIAVVYRSTTAGRITAVMLVAALLVLPGILFLGAFTLSRQVAPQPRMVPTTHSFVTSEISPPSPSTHEMSVPASETDSVHSIAYQLGFSSTSHFSETFKRHKGIQPSLLRKK